jgi:hypothetical protein
MFQDLGKTTHKKLVSILNMNKVHTCLLFEMKSDTTQSQTKPFNHDSQP